MTAASQLPLAELTVSVEAAFVTSSNVIAYCGAQASRWMRFCGSRKSFAGQRTKALACLLCCAALPPGFDVSLLRRVAMSSPAAC